jgi:predicted nuclease of predicted toxin-antitoxin system
VTFRFLVDENLTTELCDAAHRHGFHATSVTRLGKQGASDPALVRFAIDGDFIIVTRNAIDFRRLYRREAVHAGLVIILPNAPKPEQVPLFEIVLRQLETEGELINACLTIDAAGAIVIEPLHL